MLCARTTEGLFILGLDAENVRRLQLGQPIMVNLSKLGGTDDILIMVGETLEDIQETLETGFGPLPPSSTFTAQ